MWVGEHRRHMRILKRGSRRHGLTWIALAAVRCSLRWRKPIWGELKIRELWWTIEGGIGALVLWWCSKLPWPSIYRGLRRWHVIRPSNAGGRRKRGALAQWIGVLRRGNCSGDQRGARVSHGDAVDRLETRDGQRRRLNGGENPYPRAVSKGRGTAASRSGFQLTGGDDLLPCDAIHQLQAWIQSPMTRIATKNRSSAMRITETDRGGYCIMGYSFNPSNSQSLGWIFSQIFMATHTKFYSKVVSL
jgi:hypothetical protein